MYIDTRTGQVLRHPRVRGPHIIDCYRQLRLLRSNHPMTLNATQLRRFLNRTWMCSSIFTQNDLNIFTYLNAYGPHARLNNRKRSLKKKRRKRKSSKRRKRKSSKRRKRKSSKRRRKRKSSKRRKRKSSKRRRKRRKSSKRRRKRTRKRSKRKRKY